MNNPENFLNKDNYSFDIVKEIREHLNLNLCFAKISNATGKDIAATIIKTA